MIVKGRDCYGDGITFLWPTIIALEERATTEGMRRRFGVQMKRIRLIHVEQTVREVGRHVRGGKGGADVEPGVAVFAGTVVGVKDGKCYSCRYGTLP